MQTSSENYFGYIQNFTTQNILLFTRTPNLYMLVYICQDFELSNCQINKATMSVEVHLPFIKNCLHLLHNMIMSHKTNIEQIKLKLILDNIKSYKIILGKLLVIDILSQTQKCGHLKFVFAVAICIIILMIKQCVV